MKVKNILKIIGIIIAIIILLLVINTIRNYLIIIDLQNKIEKYYNSNNYSIKSVATERDGTIITMQYYKKDNKQVVFLERNKNGEKTKVSMYNNGEITNTYTETKDSKIVQLNSGTIMSLHIYNHLETENKWQTILGSIFAKIKSTDYNEKECYKIKGFLSSTSLTFEGAEIYIQKETGLAIKNIEGNIITQREYEFDNVNDSIFIEPDISLYTLK